MSALLPIGQLTNAIALTAYATAEDQAKALAAGFQAHLAKPIDADALVAAIVKLMKP